MNKVTVLRLSGCRYCSELLEKLDDAGVRYTSLDADENEKYADDVEDLIGTNSYPIVIVEVKKLFPFFIFRAETTDQVGEEPLENAVKIGTLSIDSMVEITSKLV